MTQSNAPDPLDPEVEAEGAATLGRGRPKGLIPMKTIMRRLPKMRDIALEQGKLDNLMAAEQLALLKVLTIEAGLTDETIDIKTRVDWALRGAPILAQLREGFGRKDKVKYPKTIEAVQAEQASRLEKIKKLSEALSKAPKEAIEAVLVDATSPETVEAQLEREEQLD